MIFRNLLFTTLLTALSMSLWQRHLAVEFTTHFQPIESEEHFFASLNTLDFVAPGEQRDGPVAFKIPGKLSFKTRLFSWIDNRINYRNGNIAAVRYFLAAQTRATSLEPPDIVFPFHNFW